MKKKYTGVVPALPYPKTPVATLDRSEYIKPTFEQALWYLGRVRDELLHHRENEATVVVVGTDPQYPQFTPFTVYYGYPPYIPEEHTTFPQADISRDDDAEMLWRAAYMLVNDKRG